MKKIKMNKYLLAALSLVLIVGIYIFGKGHENESGGISLAIVGAVTLSEQEKADFTEVEQKMLLAVKKLVAGVEEKIGTGKISPEEALAFKSGVIETLKNAELKTLKTELDALELKAKTQGTSLAQMELKLQNANTAAMKSIGQVLQENEAELKKVYQTGSGTKTFMVTYNQKGELVMQPYDMTKAAGPHATIDGIGGGTSAITQSINAAELLRLGGSSQIISQYRNTAWVFDLCNVVNAGFDMPFAMWYEEQVKQGASSGVAEGGSKPLVNYAYALKTAPWKKEACLIGFTDEFSLDFARLQDDIMKKGKVDLINRINSALLTNVQAAATSYNTQASYNGGVAMTNVNDYEVIAAMAAQVDNATFGALANTAAMSTFKKYRLGTLKAATSGEWLDRPSVLDNLGFIGNPDMGANDITVGDFKAYNVLLRGGFIVRVGFNGTDFAENKFSVVMEQYYMDYISDIRKKAIVKGTTFAAVKALLEA